MTASKVELRDGMVIGLKATNSAGIRWLVSLDAKNQEVVLTVIAGSSRYLGEKDRREAADLIEDLGPDGHLVIVSAPPVAEPEQLYRRDLNPGDKFSFCDDGISRFTAYLVDGVHCDSVGGPRGAIPAVMTDPVYSVIRAAQSAPPDDAERYAAAAAESTRRTLAMEALRDAGMLSVYTNSQRDGGPRITAVDYRDRASLLYTSAVTARLRARDEARRIATSVRCEGTVARENEFDE